MANNIKKNLTRVQQEYKELAQSVEPPRPILKNFLRAFIAGGTICLVGQAIQEMFGIGAALMRKKLEILPWR